METEDQPKVVEAETPATAHESTQRKEEKPVPTGSMQAAPAEVTPTVEASGGHDEHKEKHDVGCHGQKRKASAMLYSQEKLPKPSSRNTQRTRRKLAGLSVAELRTKAQRFGVAARDLMLCLEKEDLVETIMRAMY
eukprot:gnl/TRDRNA2_/TRDRNA2_177310_c3_seq9.p1 gnl/TRDRNA2_/TRDRNA2_177310_c3~~gnl/TRDRNA2_/TRDRNA2_177310_c3_seq9.p1  ORF type:complete len:145 (+),score=31.25 gnl/TRDRNA2_/TRDRNA2_177310_c3_seq9:28-435(+)